MYFYTSLAEMYIEAQKETAADILKKVLHHFNGIYLLKELYLMYV